MLVKDDGAEFTFLTNFVTTPTFKIFISIQPGINEHQVLEMTSISQNFTRRIVTIT